MIERFATKRTSLTIVNLQQDSTSASYQIKRYEPGKIWINDQCYQHSIILRPNEILPWPPMQLSEIIPAHFEALMHNLPQVLLFGTGAQCLIPPMALLKPFYAKGVGVEFMDTKAACYTFTVLAAEERNVAALLLIR